METVRLRSGSFWPVLPECESVSVLYLRSVSVSYTCFRRQSRTPSLLPLSLTIARFPSPPPTTPSNSSSSSPSSSLSSSTEPVPALSSLLELLVPLTRTLPLSLDTLNREAFSPESKEEDLHAGVLQLPQKTVLLVTETGISSGEIDERGLHLSSFAPPMLVS